jgi:hypothetical protein
MLILFQYSAKQFATRITVVGVENILVLRASLDQHTHALTLTHSRVAYLVRLHLKPDESGSGSEQSGDGGTTGRGSVQLQFSE